MLEQEVKKNISVKEVLSLLDQGKSREEIADYYGETVSAMKATVWQHPKLKNKKAKKQFAINLVDDTEELDSTEVVENNETFQQVIDDNEEVPLEETFQQTVEQENVPVKATGTW